eukprot:6198604-Pleurochrysis_carterae.AAC.1
MHSHPRQRVLTLWRALKPLLTTVPALVPVLTSALASTPPSAPKPADTAPAAPLTPSPVAAAAHTASAAAPSPARAQAPRYRQTCRAVVGAASQSALRPAAGVDVCSAAPRSQSFGRWSQSIVRSRRARCQASCHIRRGGGTLEMPKAPALSHARCAEFADFAVTASPCSPRVPCRLGR